MAKTKTRSSRAEKRAVRPPPLSSLADELGLELDELVEQLHVDASEQIARAKRRNKLLRYQATAEKCIRAFAAIEGNEKGAFELGRTLGIRAWGPDPRPQLKLDRKIRDWARDNPSAGRASGSADSATEFSGTEFVLAFAADEDNKEVLGESLRSRFEPVPKPWVLSKIEACKGYAGDDEDLEAVERRILVELGVSPNEIAAFQKGGRNHVKTYANSREARAGRRQAERLRQELISKISELKQQREAFLGNDDQKFRRLLFPAVLPDLDKQIADCQATLAKLDSRRRS